MLEAMEPVEERVEVRGIARLALGRCTRETASESEAGDPVRGKDSIVEEEAVFGEVTRDKGAELVLSRAADVDEEEPGRDDPWRLLREEDASAAAFIRFLLEAALREPTLLEEPSSGTRGMPADRNCG